MLMFIDVIYVDIFGWQNLNISLNNNKRIPKKGILLRLCLDQKLNKTAATEAE